MRDDRPAPLSWPSRLPTSGTIRLRAYTEDDLQLVEQLSRDRYIPTIGSVPATFSREEGLAFIARQHQRLVDGVGYSMVVARLSDDLGVGTAGLWVRERSAGRASAGYTTAPGQRGRGYGSAALRALTELAWSLPFLHRVELYIEPWNVSSVAVAERVGFRREGLLRSHQEIDGRRRDMLLYAAVRTDVASSP